MGALAHWEEWMESRLGDKMRAAGEEWGEHGGWNAKRNLKEKKKKND